MIVTAVNLNVAYGSPKKGSGRPVDRTLRRRDSGVGRRTNKERKLLERGVARTAH